MKDKKYLNTIIIAVSVVLIVELVILGIVVNSKTEAVSIEENKVENVTENMEKEEEKEEIPEPIKPLEDEIDVSQVDSFYIKVNYEANVVTIYIKDEEGNYTRPYKVMLCSTGTATPKSGVYKTSDKGKWGMMVGRVWAQYYTRITGQILFHSVPYTKKSANTLEYWEYDKLGTTASAGCVRLTVKDSKWIYDNCKPGTQVEFYADPDPGPLGKPEATLISNADEKLRGWDPTDIDPNNPWNNY